MSDAISQAVYPRQPLHAAAAAAAADESISGGADGVDVQSATSLPPGDEQSTNHDSHQLTTTNVAAMHSEERRSTFTLTAWN